MNSDILKKQLEYNPSTGIFKWIVRKNGIISDIAGGLTKEGYISIGINGKIYKAHRLAWIYMTGSSPSGVIDHKNGIKCDNRFENLRDVSRSENSQNQKKTRVDNSTASVPGVYLDKRSGKYRVKLQIEGKAKCFGYYISKREAELVCVEMRRKYYKGNLI